MPQVSAADNGPSGTIQLASDIFLEGGPDFYFGGVAKYSPDADGYYWGIDGTPSNPVQKVGCYTQFKFRDNIMVSEIRCDTIGVVGTIQKRNFLECDFTLLSLLPLAQLKTLIRGGTVTQNASDHAEKMGLGLIDNNKYFLTYLAKVYDQTAGSFVSITGHRCQFVDVWEISMNYGAPWTLGIKLRMYADTSKPDAQKFATVLRYDPTLL
jgi:hypothetical protein